MGEMIAHSCSDLLCGAQDYACPFDATSPISQKSNEMQGGPFGSEWLRFLRRMVRTVPAFRFRRGSVFGFWKTVPTVLVSGSGSAPSNATL